MLIAPLLVCVCVCVHTHMETSVPQELPILFLEAGPYMGLELSSQAMLANQGFAVFPSPVLGLQVYYTSVNPGF